MLCSQGKEGGSGLCIPFGMGKCPSHFLLDAGMVNSGFLLVGCRAGIQLQMNRRDGADSLGLCWVPLSANGKCQGSPLEFQGNFRRTLLKPRRHWLAGDPVPESFLRVETFIA